MKKTHIHSNYFKLALIIFFAGSFNVLNAQNKSMGVGTPTPNANAALHVESQTGNQGAILPRLTTVQRTSMTLATTDKGLIVFDTDVNALMVWNGTTWITSDGSVNFPIVGNANSTVSSLEISESNASNSLPVVSITNSGTGAAIQGTNTMSSSPTVTAHGVMGVATSGGNNAGVYGTGNGTGVMGETTTGWSAIFGYQHNPTIGWAADFEIDAPTNNWASVFAHTGGLGPAGVFRTGNVSNDTATVDAETMGTGYAGRFVINNPASTNPALYGKTNGAFSGNSSGVMGESAGGFAGVLALQTSGLGNALVARSTSPDAGSWGLLAESTNGAAGVFNSSATEHAVQITANGVGGGLNIQTTATSTGTGLSLFQLGTARGAQIQINNATNTNAAIRGATLGLGNAGFFSIVNAANTSAALNVATDGLGTGGNFYISNSSNTSPSIFSENAGVGNAGHFKISNAVSTSTTLESFTDGEGSAGSFWITNVSNTVPAFNAWTEGLGSAGSFSINNTSNGNAALNVSTLGTGSAIYSSHQGSSGHAADLVSSNSSNSASTLNVGNTGTGGAAANFYIADPASTQNTINVTNDGLGIPGFFSINNASNNNVAASVNTIGTGGSLYVGSNNSSSASPTLSINNNGVGSTLQIAASGTGTGLFMNHTGASGDLAIFQKNGANVARIDGTGQGLFNGGTASSGADVAEMFDVEGERNTYEPGDVLVISEKTDRTVEKSSEAVSTRVAGVYATKPGVRLTERSLDENLDDLVPMGVVGVIPTKVCLENGPIKRGDLLVTSSTKGHAMKAIPVNINGVLIYPTGAILGKALENFDGQQTGLIKVLVNVK